MRKIAFIFLSVLSMMALADVVVMKNGDKITGTVTSMENGTITIATEMFGDVKADMANVDTFSIESVQPVHLTDGSILQGRLSKEDSTVTVTGDTVSSRINAEDITAINPAPPEPIRWKGSVYGSVSVENGNTESETYGGGAHLSRRGEDDRITLSGDYARGKDFDVVTEHWWDTRAKYDYFITQKTYVFGEGRYEKDAMANLDRRTILGGGLGHQFIETPEMNFNVEAGLASMHESYENPNTSDSRLSAQAGYHFDKRLMDNLMFINELKYYPSTEQVSDYYLTSFAELRLKINSRMFTNYKFIFDYDATPSQGNNSTDTKHILGVGVDF
jgi:putative salt-induced outer membrane protein YdiY